MTKTIENFLRYVKIDTQSSEESTTTPSTMKQHDLAGLLVSELEAMGATEITYRSISLQVLLRNRFSLYLHMLQVRV